MDPGPKRGMYTSGWEAIKGLGVIFLVGAFFLLGVFGLFMLGKFLVTYL